MVVPRVAIAKSVAAILLEGLAASEHADPPTQGLGVGELLESNRGKNNARACVQCSWLLSS